MRSEQNLSKEEISELARAMSEVQADAGAESLSVRAYDFAHPDKLSKQNLRALELVFSELARSWSGTLSSSLKTSAAVLVNPSEQVRFADYADSAREPRLVFEFTMDSLPGVALVDVPAALGLSMVDRMTGGSGEASAQTRALTQIERNIVKRVINQLMADLAEAWKPVTEVQFRFSRYYNSLSEMEMDSQESVLLVTTAWSIGGKQSDISILMPVRCLYPALDLLVPQRWLTIGDEAHQTSPALVTNLLREVEMTMTVELGRARVSLEDAMNLEVGDVIRLETSVEDQLPAAIDGKLMFYVRPGLTRNRVSVQVTSRAQDAPSGDEAAVTRTESQTYAGAA